MASVVCPLPGPRGNLAVAGTVVRVHVAGAVRVNLVLLPAALDGPLQARAD